jgi:hypothetical protein
MRYSRQLAGLGPAGDQPETRQCISTVHHAMKMPKVAVLIDRTDYDVFAAAARLARAAAGKDTPDTATLIAFQFKLRTPEGLAKDYLDCLGEAEARYNVGEQLSGRPRSKPRKLRLAACPARLPAIQQNKTGRGVSRSRSARSPTDLSRN